MATVDLYKNLLGYDPREQQLQQQKMVITNSLCLMASMFWSLNHHRQVMPH